MSQYLPIVVLMILAVVFGVISLIMSHLLAPRRPSSAKEAPYECGIIPSREPPERFPVSFYIVAMLFVMFDIEIIFVYPYAIAHSALGVYGFVAILIFSGLFFLTFVYEVARGGLDWGPLQRSRNMEDDAALGPFCHVRPASHIGAGAKILGNIEVGHCARIAAGSVVLKAVPPNTTVAGVPARVVGTAGCAEPSRTMDQMLYDLGP